MSRFALGMFSFLIVLVVCLVGVVVFAGTGLLDRQETPFTTELALDTTEVVEADSLAANGRLPIRNTIARGPVPQTDAAAVAAGDALFKNYCVQCHAVNDVVVGPALSDITKRRPITWLIPWVKNSGKVVASGDEYAVKLFNQYQKQQMPSFQLSDEEIKNIMQYIEAESYSASVSFTIVD